MHNNGASRLLATVRQAGLLRASIEHELRCMDKPGQMQRLINAITQDLRFMKEGMGAKFKDVSGSSIAVAKDLHLNNCPRHRYSIVKRWTHETQFIVIERCRWCNDYKRTSLDINADSTKTAPELTTIRYIRNEEPQA